MFAAGLVLLVSMARAGWARELSLEEALRLAQGASEDLEVARATETRAEGAVINARSGYLPTLSGSVSAQHKFASEFDSLAASGFDLPFAKADTWRVDLSGSQLLFAAGRVRGQNRGAVAGEAAAHLGVEAERANTTLQTAAAYYDVVLAVRLVDVAEEALARAETTLAQTRLAREVDKKPEFDVLRAATEVESQRAAVLRQRRARQVAELRLAQWLDLPDEPLVLSSGLEDQVSETARTIAQVGPTESRLAVQQVEQTVEAAKASIAATRALAFPQLGLTASYGWVAYPEGFRPPAASDWQDNFSVGAALSVPLYGGGRLRGTVLDAEGSLLAAEARLGRIRELATLEERDAHAGLEAALAQWEAAKATGELADQANRIADVRFQEGVSSQIELVDARLAYERALMARAQAARDVQIARIRLALLPALPIGALPPTTF